MDYEGVIIEESLKSADILKDVTIVSTKVEPITTKHKTPWLKQWTLHTVRIPSDTADTFAEEVSKALNRDNWYVDYKNERTHYIIFPHKVFKIDRKNVAEYNTATEYGLTLGIPEYQLDFAPNVIHWESNKD